MILGAAMDVRTFSRLADELMSAAEYRVASIIFEYDGEEVSTIVLMLPNTRLDRGRAQGVDHAAKRMAELIAPELIARWGK